MLILRCKDSLNLLWDGIYSADRFSTHNRTENGPQWVAKIYHLLVIEKLGKSLSLEKDEISLYEILLSKIKSFIMWKWLISKYSNIYVILVFSMLSFLIFISHMRLYAILFSLIFVCLSVCLSIRYQTK